MSKKPNRKKKDRERRFLEEFAAIYPEFPAGEIIDSERPDFLIKQDTKKIGIEIVEYNRGQNKNGSNKRRNEELWQRVANEAKKKFEAQYKSPLHVSFSWDDRHILRSSQISQLADDAVNIIKKQIPIQLFESARISPDELDGTLLGKVCHSITIMRVRNKKQVTWSFADFGWIEVTTNEIQDILDSKNNKVREYLKKCDEVWLLIVAAGERVSTHIDISNTEANNVYRSLFKRAFIYDRSGKKVFPLKLQ